MKFSPTFLFYDIEVYYLLIRNIWVWASDKRVRIFSRASKLANSSQNVRHSACRQHMQISEFDVIRCVKAQANEDTLLRTHCCSWCFLGCANWETFVADIKFFWTKSETYFVSRTQNSCPQPMLRARANGETFVSATMCPQQCVLVCQGFKTFKPS